jgi:hypothetical protein
MTGARTSAWAPAERMLPSDSSRPTRAGCHVGSTDLLRHGEAVGGRANGAGRQQRATLEHATERARDERAHEQRRLHVADARAVEVQFCGRGEVASALEANRERSAPRGGLRAPAERGSGAGTDADEHAQPDLKHNRDARRGSRRRRWLTDDNHPRRGGRRHGRRRDGWRRGHIGSRTATGDRVDGDADGELHGRRQLRAVAVAGGEPAFGGRLPVGSGNLNPRLEHVAAPAHRRPNCELSVLVERLVAESGRHPGANDVDVRTLQRTRTTAVRQSRSTRRYGRGRGRDRHQ